jgi:hypothetical protein
VRRRISSKGNSYANARSSHAKPSRHDIVHVYVGQERNKRASRADYTTGNVHRSACGYVATEPHNFGTGEVHPEKREEAHRQGASQLQPETRPSLETESTATHDATRQHRHAHASSCGVDHGSSSRDVTEDSNRSSAPQLFSNADRRMERSGPFSPKPVEIFTLVGRTSGLLQTATCPHPKGSLGKDFPSVSTRDNQVHETLRQASKRTQSAPRRCAASVEFGRAASSHQGFSDPQIRELHPTLCGSVPEPTGGSGGPRTLSTCTGPEVTSDVSNASSGSNWSHDSLDSPTERCMNRTLHALSGLRLGIGPCMRGFGTHATTENDTMLVWSTLLCEERSSSQYTPSSISPSTVTWSSDTPSTTWNIDGLSLRHPTTRSDRSLAELSCNVINTRIIENWDEQGDFREVANLIRSEIEFRSLFMSLPDLHLRRSRMSAQNISIIEHSNTIEDTREYQDPLCYVNVFQVPKKDSTDRLIVDATPINRVQTKPHSMNLPKFHWIMEQLLKFPWRCTIDAKNYFYQFLIEDELIRNYFTIAFNKKRGRPFLRRFCRLPMGWKFAPCIAQRASNVIAHKIAHEARLLGLEVFVTVWVDNFILAAKTESDAKTLLALATKIFTECNIEMHPATAIDTSFEILGCILDNDCIRHATKFRTKYRDALAKTSTPLFSLHDLSVLLGCFTWSIFVKRTPFCLFPAVHSAMKEVAHRIRAGATWDDIVTFDASQAIAEAATVCDQVSLPIPICTRDNSERFTEIFSDAMIDDDIATWAYESGTHSRQGVFPFRSDIFILEVSAACFALKAAAQRNPCSHAVIFVDNSATVHAFRAGHSGNTLADALLRNLFMSIPATFTFQICHISGDLNPSDSYTRGRVASTGQWLDTYWG